MTLFARYAHRPWWRSLPTLVVTAVLAWLMQAVDDSGVGVVLAVNTFEMVDWLMQDTLDLLVNKLSIGSHFNTDVQKEFERDFAPGETVRVPFPQEFLIRNGLGYTPQPINRRSTTVTCNEIFGIDFDYDSFEKALKMERSEEQLRKNYSEPAAAQMFQEIESRCALYAYQHASTLVGALGTDPTTFDGSSAAARQKLVELGCPAGKDRAMILPPAVMRALKNTAIGYFNPVQDIAKQFRTGIIGSGDGFDWYESVSLYSHTAGTWAGAVTVNGANQSGSTLTITATAGDTFKKGDKVSVANVNPVNPRTRRRVGASARTFTVLNDPQLTAAGGGVDVLQISPAIYGPGSQYQNVDALPANGAALTLFPGTTSPNGKSGNVGLAIHPDAFALVGVKFENPKESSVQIARQIVDDETGIPIAFIRDFDSVGRRWINRFDTCIGFGELYASNCAVAVLCA